MEDRSTVGKYIQMSDDNVEPEEPPPVQQTARKSPPHDQEAQIRSR